MFFSFHFNHASSIFARRRTKTGVSVWHFCWVSETKQFFAVGGDDMKVISCSDRKHLRQVYENFKRYGYTSKLKPLKAKRMAPVADPLGERAPPGLTA